MTGRTLALRLRQSPAGIVGLFVFLVLVFLVPAAHQIGHRADHEHGVFGVESHGFGQGASHRHDVNGDDIPDAPKRDPRHGHGSTDHFSAAFSFAAPVVVPPCACIAIQERPDALESFDVAPLDLPLQPRAPPSTT